jgi:cbb3-type cytochrome oxidase subunit 3
MSLTEIVSFLELSIFPSIALVFFLTAFMAILWRVLRQPRAETDLAASIPLDDDVVFTPRVSIKEKSTDMTDKGASHG